MDYGSPVAISKFVHYFYVPQVKDYRTDPLLLSSSFTAVNVYRSDDGGEWKLAERREALRPGWPQVIALSQPEPARHYKLEITSLTAGAEGIRTYEVESFMGPVIHDAITAPALLMSGQQTKLRGLVIAPRPGLAISVARSEPVEPEKKRVLVSANGRFTVPLTPLRAGAVPVMLELKDDENTVLDSCEVIFRAAPRVAVGNLKVIGDTLSGRLLNTSTVALSVAVRNGRSSTPALRLDSGAGSEFSLSGAITGAGRQVVKFWIWTRVIDCRTYFNSTPTWMNSGAGRQELIWRPCSGWQLKPLIG